MSDTPVRKWLLSRYDHFLVPMLICFILGITIAHVVPTHSIFNLGLLPWLVMLLFGLTVWSGFRNRIVFQGSLWLLALIIGGVYFQWRTFEPGPTDISHEVFGGPLSVEGILVDRGTTGKRAIVEVRNLNGKTTTGFVQISKAPEPVPEVGALVSLSGELRPPREASAPGNFNERRWLLQRHVTAILRPSSAISILDAGPVTWQTGLARNLERIRERIASTFKSVLPSPEAEVLGGVVLGDRAIPVERPVRERFVHTGLVHILAASGMNVGIITGFVLLLCGRLRVPRRMGYVLALLALGLYCALTGLPPSIQRAGAMLALALVLKAVDRELSSLFLLCIAVAALLIVNPDAVGSIGFQFSVLTTLGLIVLLPPLQEALGPYITRWASGLILVPFVAQLWILPLSIHYFNEMPLHSVPLNVLALMTVVPLTTLGFTAGALSLAWEPLGKGIALLAWPFLKGLLWLVSWGNDMTWARTSLPAPEPWFIAACYLWLGILTLCLRQFPQVSIRRKALVGTACLGLCLLPLAWQRWTDGSETQLELVPLSHKHAAFVLHPPDSGETMVLTSGNLNFWEGRTLSDYLRHRNLVNLSAVVTWTDPDSDAEGFRVDGWKPVLRGRTIQNFFYLSNTVSLDHKPALARFLETRGLAPQPLPLDRKLALGKIELIGLDPTREGLFELRAGRFCLEAGREGSYGGARTCTLSYTEPGNQGYGLRLKDKTRIVEPGRFHRFQASEDSLRVY